MFTVPGFVKDRLQFDNRLPPDTEAKIPKAQFVGDTAGILVTDIEPPQKGQRTVDNGHLAMIPFIEPVQTSLERGDIELEQLDPLFGKVFKVGGGRVETADIIVDQPDRDSALNGSSQLVRQSAPETIVMDEIVFQQDGMFRRVDGGKKRLEKLSPPMKEFDTIMTVGDRQLQRTQSAQQADKSGKPLFMFEVIASHVAHTTLHNRYSQAPYRHDLGGHDVTGRYPPDSCRRAGQDDVTRFQGEYRRNVGDDLRDAVDHV